MTGIHVRRGFVLLIALFAIILTGALVTAIVFRAGEAGRVTRAATLREATFADAEAALWGTVFETDAASLRMLPVGTRVSIPTDIFGTSVVVVRTDSTIYWVVATAERRQGQDVGRRRLGVTATLPADTTVHRLALVSHRAWVDLY